MKRKIIWTLLILITMYWGFIYNVDAIVYEMDDTIYETMGYENLDLSIGKLNGYDINSDSISVIRDDDKNVITLVADNNSKSAVTYEADANSDKPYLLKLKYKNVTKVGSRNIDVNVYITRIQFGNFWNNGLYYNDEGAAFGFVVDDGFWVGSELGSSDYRYSAHSNVDVTTEIIWADDHTVVDLPFLAIQSDIDVNRNKTTSPTNYTKEKWKILSGFTGDYYIFAGTTLDQDENGAWYNTGSQTNEAEGSDSFIKTGVYAPTNNGLFSSSYHEGISASRIGISMQTFTLPVHSYKVVGADNTVKDAVDSVDDKVILLTEQKFGELYSSVFVPYSEFEINDKIDSDLNYESAEVLIVDGDNVIDITNNSAYGELIYDSDTGIVKYVFNSTWLSNIDNYKGQMITMNITTTLKGNFDELKNDVVTTLDDIDFPAEEIEIAYSKKKALYKNASGTEGRELPSELASNSGEYIISDPKEYLIGETVNRKDGKPAKTKYDVYENGVLVGTWVFDGWNKDSDIMDADGVEFVGSWKYTAINNPNTFDNVTNYMILSVSSIAGLYIVTRLFKKKRVVF